MKCVSIPCRTTSAGSRTWSNHVESSNFGLLRGGIRRLTALRFLGGSQPTETLAGGETVGTCGRAAEEEDATEFAVFGESWQCLVSPFGRLVWEEVFAARGKGDTLGGKQLVEGGVQERREIGPEDKARTFQNGLALGGNAAVGELAA
jgi:hypothetical protein